MTWCGKPDSRNSRRSRTKMVFSRSLWRRDTNELADAAARRGLDGLPGPVLLSDLWSLQLDHGATLRSGQLLLELGAGDPVRTGNDRSVHVAGPFLRGLDI